MKGIDSLKLLDGLDNELISSAEQLKKRRSPLRTILPIAAGLCLVIGAALDINKLFPRESKPDTSALATQTAVSADTSETGTPTAEPTAEAPTAEPANMIDLERYVYGAYDSDGVFRLYNAAGTETSFYDPDDEPSVAFKKGFFIYGGRIYSQIMSCGALSDCIGDTVCEIRSIDREQLYGELSDGVAQGQPPRIDASEYEGMGTSDCIMHEVKGYDPGFLLCMRNESLGYIDIYAADIGYESAPASAVFEDRLALSDDLSEVRFTVNKRNENAPYGAESHMYRLYAVDYRTEIAALIDALDSAEWTDDIWNAYSYSFTEGTTDGFFDYPNSYTTIVQIPLKNDFVLELCVYSDGTIVFPDSCFDKALKADMQKLGPFLRLVESEAGTELGGDPLSAQTIEACRADEHMGYLVPEYLPKGFFYNMIILFLDFDQLTGRMIGTDSIRIEYKQNSLDAVINLWILKPDKFEKEAKAFTERGGTIVPLSELTLADIVEWNDRPEIPDDVISLAAVTAGDYGIYVESIGADAEIVYSILSSIPDR